MADSGLIAPDVVLFLDLPLEEAAKRGQYGDERYENLEFQRKVSDVYSRLKEQNWKVFSMIFSSYILYSTQYVFFIWFTSLCVLALINETSLINIFYFLV